MSDGDHKEATDKVLDVSKENADELVEGSSQVAGEDTEVDPPEVADGEEEPEAVAPSAPDVPASTETADPVEEPVTEREQAECEESEVEAECDESEVEASVQDEAEVADTTGEPDVSDTPEEPAITPASSDTLEEHAVTPASSDNEKEALGEQEPPTPTDLIQAETTTESRFAKLKEIVTAEGISNREAVSNVLNLLVSGEFDLETNCVIRHAENITLMLDMVDSCSTDLKAEVWSMFTAMLRKCSRSLHTCVEAGLFSSALSLLPDSEPVVADLLVEMLSVLASYSISERDLTLLLDYLQVQDGCWKTHSEKVLKILKAMAHRHGPDEFFSFSGKLGGVITIPPLSAWPYQAGWSFSTWLRLEPTSGVIETDRPFLFSFMTNKGVGYQAHFIGSCLVLTFYKTQGKGLQQCVNFEFKPRKWYHVAISYSYSRWSKSEVRCYINGEQAHSSELQWLVTSPDPFDRCVVGGRSEQSLDTMFAGQLASVYAFSEALPAATVQALFQAGSNNKSQFLFEVPALSAVLTDEQRKLLFSGHLSSTILFLYTPISCDHQICLESSPRSHQHASFMHSPHAMMGDGVQAVKTKSIFGTLHSLGGIQCLLPLFGQLDLPGVAETGVCAKLVEVLSALAVNSREVQVQMLQSKAFLVITSLLEKVSAKHLTTEVLKEFIQLTEHFVRRGSTTLIRHLFDHILFNPALWCKAGFDVQLQLYTYLSSQFLDNPTLYNTARRFSVVVQVMHALRHQYWVAGGTENGSRAELTKEQWVQLREQLLIYIKQLIIKSNGIMEDEMQALLNFVSTVSEDENLSDVLMLLICLMADQPATMIPSFDRKNGVQVVFKLLKSSCEMTRLKALKLLAYFLSRSKHNRKVSVMGVHHLFFLLTDRLLKHADRISMPVYGALLEIMTERVSPDNFGETKQSVDKNYIIENPQLLKVIGQLIAHSKPSYQTMDVKKAFLSHLITLCNQNKFNRRTVLQQSVWQDWLFQIAYFHPKNNEEQQITDQVFDIFSSLLFHAIKHEYGGWRVWIDTMSILHSKLSYEDWRERVQAASSSDTPEDGKVADEWAAAPRMAPFRVPEFTWSQLHQRLLSDLLLLLEGHLDEWRETNEKSVGDMANLSDNHIFVINCTHVISQLSDMIVSSCGGLLPLLAAAAHSSGSESVEQLEPEQGLPLEVALQFLRRLVGLADVVVLSSNLSLTELEQEKNMTTGATLRQILRCVCTLIVHKRLLTRRSSTVPLISDEDLSSFPTSFVDTKNVKVQDAIDMLVEAVQATACLSTGGSSTLLEPIDVLRLRATLYRDYPDKEEVKQSQFLSMAILYFSCVLMVSRYRDILEPPSSGVSSPSSSARFSEGAMRDHPETLNGNGDVATESAPVEEAEIKVEVEVPATGKDEVAKDAAISSIQIDAVVTDAGAVRTADISELKLPEMNLEGGASSDMSLSDRLTRAMYTVAPLVKEIFHDFEAFLSKTMVGSHGQELLRPGVKSLSRDSAVVELVMLLCSQEWQNALQKHAGLSFIELVNEGRLLSHATREHLVRVANEAEFILNQMRATDVQKHGDFDTIATKALEERVEEDNLCHHLITSARHRDRMSALRIREKVFQLQQTVNTKHTELQFWKLDNWEDDSRRRQRLVRNPAGNRHLEASNRTDQDASPDLKAALTGGGVGQPRQTYTDEELMLDTDAAEFQPAPETKGPVVLMTAGKLITYGLAISGTVSITKTELYFEIDETESENAQLDSKVLQYVEQLHAKWTFQEIRAIFSRRYLLQDNAIEIFMASRTAVMISFKDRETVRAVINALPRVGVGLKYGLPQQRRSSLATGRQIYRLSGMTAKWQKREISNFDYLMFLNTIAGRSYNDLNQYPVFPWVLSNYDSKELDLGQPSNYRDLSKPIGALNQKRRATFEERYSSWDHDTVPAFHYGTHYSTSAFTLNWLLRTEPFTTLHLYLQGGKFDNPNRLFHSVETSWLNCQKDTSDVKELIPEWYYLPEMFVNTGRYSLGQTDDGTVVSDVVLPAWAKSPEEFVRINRQALESELVSCQLHHWVDLIFGYKQRGPEAVRACNVFYYLTYEGALDVESIKDPVMKEALLNQIRSFGQTPSQLLTEPHPPRNSAMHVMPLASNVAKEELVMLMKFASNSAVCHLAANTSPHIPSPGVIAVMSNYNFSVNKWVSASQAPVASRGEKESVTGVSPDLPPTKQVLPLQMDPTLLSHASAQKRTLGRSFDERRQPTCESFVVTADNKFIIVTAFWDKSFRVFSVDTGQPSQVIFGHYGLVTCVCRSEAIVQQDCYVATGSEDCAVALWHWSAKQAVILGDNASVEQPTPKATLTGHLSEVTCVAVSGELGLVFSGSLQGVVLVHTTFGAILHRLDSDTSPRHLLVNREGRLVVAYEGALVRLFTVNGRALATLDTEDKTQCVLLSRDGCYLVTGSSSGQVKVWSLASLSPLHSFPQVDAAVRSLALSHDHRFLLAGLSNGTIVVYNIDFNIWHEDFQARYQ